jgi:plasmid maintenance system antidote protein VapI
MDDLVIRLKHAGVVETDENRSMSLDLVALLPDGAGSDLMEEMEARSLTVDDLAASSGLGRETLDAVLACRVVITEEMSRTISRALGIEQGDFWARLDAGIRREKTRLL